MMSTAKKLVNRITNEDDPKILKEVLDFYEYLEYKKKLSAWETIEEDEATADELEAFLSFSKEETSRLIPIEDIVERLGKID